MPEKKTVLCVDDDPYFGDFYRSVLELKGYKVTIASDPDAGYAAAVKSPPSVMILDVMMPEKGDFPDGYAVLKALAGKGMLKDLPVIMISGLGNDDDMKHGLEIGAKAYLRKSDLTPKRLAETIEKVLKE